LRLSLARWGSAFATAAACGIIRRWPVPRIRIQVILLGHTTRQQPKPHYPETRLATQEVPEVYESAGPRHRKLPDVRFPKMYGLPL
jgi:hypothetical protein